MSHMYTQVCYDCGVAFSFFRRRHHCRLCGQIFCFECSERFIDGAPHGHAGQIRVCNFCAHYVEEAEMKKTMVHAQRRSSLSRGTSLGVAIDHRSPDVDTVSPLLCSTATEAVGESTMDSIEFSSVTNSFLDSPPSPDAVEMNHRGFSAPPPPPLFTIQSSETMDVDEFDEMRIQKTFRSRPHLPRRRRSSAELLGAIESGGLLESELKQLKLGIPGSALTSPASLATTARNSFTAQPPMSYRLKSDVQSQREVGLGKYMVRTFVAALWRCGL